MPKDFQIREGLAYFQRKELLTLQNGCLLLGTRLIIPTKFRKSILESLHQQHLDLERIKAIMRSYYWWPSVELE